MLKFIISVATTILAAGLLTFTSSGPLFCLAAIAAMTAAFAAAVSVLNDVRRMAGH